MAAIEESNVILGSGDLYIGQVDPSATEDQITAALVNVGAISGGAVLTYKPKFHDIVSANRGTFHSFKTDEEVTFKSGILTWNLENIEQFSAAYYSEDTTKGTRRVGVGGMKNIPINYLRFVHTKPDGNKLIVNIFKAQSQGGFDLTFDSTKESIIDAEFKALAVLNKTDGNLVEIIEEVGVRPAPTITALTPTTVAASSEPTLITVTGTGFTQDSVVFVDNTAISDIDLTTIYVSSTQLRAIVEHVTSGTQMMKVKNGSIVSDSSQFLTIS